MLTEQATAIEAEDEEEQGRLARRLQSESAAVSIQRSQLVESVLESHTDRLSACVLAATRLSAQLGAEQERIMGELQTSGDFAAVAAILGEQRDPVRNYLDALAALTVPDAAAAYHRAQIEGFEAIEGAVDGVLAAIEAGDVAAIQTSLLDMLALFGDAAETGALVSELWIEALRT